MSGVFFFDYLSGESALKGIEMVFAAAKLGEVIPKGGSVAVKVHMGEYGNVNYLRPVLVRKIVDLVRGSEGEPFVTDTTTLYPKRRRTAQGYLETAAGNGFTEETVGAPIVIADGEEGYDGARIPVRKRVAGCELREVEVAEAIARADAMVVVTHVKGHALAGLGGSIKNVAMGCATKPSKAAQHMLNRPVLDGSLCDGCGICAELCLYGALAMEEGLPVRDPGRCMSCSNCLFSCPQEAFRWPEGCKEGMQVYMAHTAQTVLSVFPRRRVAFLNFVQDVSSLCDCQPLAGRPIVQDVGILSSLDIVSIDKASLDLVDQAQPIPGSGSVDPPDRLGKTHKTSSLVQLETAERLGMGSLSYRLITVAP